MSGVNWLRPQVQALPEETVVPPSVEAITARWGLQPGEIVKLDANENPYGPSPLVTAALARLNDYHLYPDSLYTACREGLGRYTGLTPEHVIVTNGADEAIQLVIQATIEPGNRLLDNVPTFVMYGWNAVRAGGTVLTIPRRRDQDYHLDLRAILEAITSDRDGNIRVIVICNPNNPTGTLSPQAEIESVLGTGRLVIVDEAYYEFCGSTVIPLLHRYDNLVILRTMSKWAALAGLRVGYLLADPALCRQIDKLRLPFNVNVVAQMATLLSLADRDYLMNNVARLVAERDRLLVALQHYPFLRPYPSVTNFVLCDVIGADAPWLRERLQQAGILVRLFAKRPNLDNAIRISVGRPEETNRLLSVLDQIAAELHAA